MYVQSIYLDGCLAGTERSGRGKKQFGLSLYVWDGCYRRATSQHPSVGSFTYKVYQRHSLMPPGRPDETFCC